MPDSLLLIALSGLRDIPEAEMISGLTAPLRALPRRVIQIDMAQFSEDIDAGDWHPAHRHLRQRSDEIRRLADELGDPQIHFWGLAEVSEVVAFGALLGADRPIVLHEFDRDTGQWTWPGDTLKQVTLAGLPPMGFSTSQSGIGVVRVEISASITDRDVGVAVGTELLADVSIRLAGEQPAVAKIRSAGNVEIVRLAFRRALASLRASFPNLQELHLFVAGPVSVAFAVGQELVPRNSPPVQTYRYRATEEDACQQPAILISNRAIEAEHRLLSQDEVECAHDLRARIWPEVARELGSYAAQKADVVAQPWFAALEPHDVLIRVRPFPALPPLHRLVSEEVRVDPEPFPNEFRYDGFERNWQLSDVLLVGLNKAAQGDDVALRKAIFLFLVHEYVHDHHCITSNTSREIGKFPNVLEHVDYAADAYSLLHLLDFTLSRSKPDGRNDIVLRNSLATNIELIIKSFWAFEVLGRSQWEVRRLRRHLNWYWRHVQVLAAPDLETAIRLISKKPTIELAGLRYSARGRRVILDLARRDPTTTLELAVVLENESVYRQLSGPNTNLDDLCKAFAQRDHSAIVGFFRALFDLSPRDGRLPDTAHG